MIKTKISKKGAKAIKVLRDKMAANRLTIMELSYVNDSSNRSIFEIASGGNPRLAENALIVDGPDGLAKELIAFEDECDKTEYHLKAIKLHLVNIKDYEVAADIRAIEQKLRKKNMI